MHRSVIETITASANQHLRKQPRIRSLIAPTHNGVRCRTGPRQSKLTNLALDRIIPSIIADAMVIWLLTESARRQTPPPRRLLAAAPTQARAPSSSSPCSVASTQPGRRLGLSVWGLEVCFRIEQAWHAATFDHDVRGASKCRHHQGAHSPHSRFVCCMLLRSPDFPPYLVH